MLTSVNNNTNADIENKRRPIKTKTHCVILTAFFPNIGHMYWPPVRGNKWFFCTDLLAVGRVSRVAAREGPFVRETC